MNDGRWCLSMFIASDLNNNHVGLQETDMDDFMKTEAKDIISTAIEKASGATGINVEVSLRF